MIFLEETKMNKPKALVFYQYLPPWRIDVFNEMGKYYELTIVFTNADCEGFKYNRQELLNKLYNIKTIFLNNGFKIGSRPVRFGIYMLIKKLKPEVIFSHEYSPTSILVAFYKEIKLFSYKYYLTTSDNTAMAEASTGLKAKARSYVLNHSDGIIVYSKAVKTWYQKAYPKLKRIEICPNIQNPQSLLNYRKDFKSYIEKYKKEFNLYNTNIILYTGRLVQVKGLDLLLNAFSHIPTNYKLVIVGEGNEKNNLLQQCKQLNITDQVIFAGYYSGTALYAWYDLANFFILPSRYEPFGAVVNEALVYGCPVVASKYIGALDFITSSNGVIFDPLDENNFIEILNNACIQYQGDISKQRNNLMPYSFDTYVHSFYAINQ